MTEIAPTDLVQRLLERAGEAWAVGGVRIVHGGRMVPPSLSLRDAGLENGMVVHAVSSGAAGAAGAAAAGEHTAGEGAEDSVGPICRICHDGAFSTRSGGRAAQQPFRKQQADATSGSGVGRAAG